MIQIAGSGKHETPAVSLLHQHFHSPAPSECVSRLLPQTALPAQFTQAFHQDHSRDFRTHRITTIFPDVNTHQQHLKQIFFST